MSLGVGQQMSGVFCSGSLSRTNLVPDPLNFSDTIENGVSGEISVLALRLGLERLMINDELK